MRHTASQRIHSYTDLTMTQARLLSLSLSNLGHSVVVQRAPANDFIPGNARADVLAITAHLLPPSTETARDPPQVSRDLQNNQTEAYARHVRCPLLGLARHDTTLLLRVSAKSALNRQWQHAKAREADGTCESCGGPDHIAHAIPSRSAHFA